MSATLTRLALTQSRLSEYFSAKELAMQIGGDEDLWPLILVKELIDNALDASEPHGPPIIEVEVQADHFRVADNGPGLPDEVLVGSLDYSQRISTKAAYVSPTRGRLGNALKVLWAAPFVASGNRPVTLTVDTPRSRHSIHVTYDAIRQEPTLTCTLQKLADEVSEIIKAINSEEVATPPDLVGLIKETLALDPELSWDEAITALVEANDDQRREAA